MAPATSPPPGQKNSAEVSVPANLLSFCAPLGHLESPAKATPILQESRQHAASDGIRHGYRLARGASSDFVCRCLSDSGPGELEVRLQRLLGWLSRVPRLLVLRDGHGKRVFGHFAETIQIGRKHLLPKAVALTAMGH